MLLLLATFVATSGPIPGGRAWEMTINDLASKEVKTYRTVETMGKLVGPYFCYIKPGEVERGAGVLSDMLIQKAMVTCGATVGDAEYIITSETIPCGWSKDPEVHGQLGTFTGHESIRLDHKPNKEAPYAAGWIIEWKCLRD